jgi:hypothetical protein
MRSGRVNPQGSWKVPMATQTQTQHITADSLRTPLPVRAER